MVIFTIWLFFFYQFHPKRKSPTLIGIRQRELINGNIAYNYIFPFFCKGYWCVLRL